MTSATNVSKRDTGNQDAPLSSAALRPPPQNEVDDKYLLSFDMFDQCNDNDILMKEHIQFFDEMNFSGSETNQGIKKSLSKNFNFWKRIGTYDQILRIIEHGYHINFEQNPPKIFLKNNKSAESNSDLFQIALVNCWNQVALYRFRSSLLLSVL